MEKFKVLIEYCPTCGYLKHAVRLTERVLTEFTGSVEELTLKEGTSNSVLEITVNGTPIHSSRQTMKLPVDARVIARMHELIDETE